MSANRIEAKLEQLKEKNEKAFITYLTAGLPDMERTKAIVKAQEAAGTDKGEREGAGGSRNGHRGDRCTLF